MQQLFLCDGQSFAWQLLELKIKRKHVFELKLIYFDLFIWAETLFIVPVKWKQICQVQDVLRWLSPFYFRPYLIIFWSWKLFGHGLWDESDQTAISSARWIIIMDRQTVAWVGLLEDMHRTGACQSLKNINTNSWVPWSIYYSWFRKPIMPNNKGKYAVLFHLFSLDWEWDGFTDTEIAVSMILNDWFWLSISDYHSDYHPWPCRSCLRAQYSLKKHFHSDIIHLHEGVFSIF